MQRGLPPSLLDSLKVQAVAGHVRPHISERVGPRGRRTGHQLGPLPQQHQRHLQLSLYRAAVAAALRQLPAAAVGQLAQVLCGCGAPGRPAVR